ncbi:uncharacterized protein LOC132911397 [Bombus pascuorum]|uniref:uncharacterized protein LOC132911397 n=1 Tax=Bombus pascuorum TaxID=65598 RepID=UPI00298E9804|nr:uncharacterized protein LOC132911397 [Bombus pascuorum]
MRDLLILVIAVLAVTGNAFAEIYEIPTKCPESSGKTVLLAHKHDCTKFYECSNGQKQLSNCPEFAPGQKLHFDPELRNCTFPWEANCASRAPDCSIDEFIQPHPTNCSLYYKCENGEKVLKTCDVEQLFCSDSLKCVHKDAAKCKVYDSCPTSKLLEAILLPHHRRSLYYECVDGQYVVRRCPSGHVFDNEVRLCVSKIHCPATGIKRISHETDCGLYYECVDGVKVEKVCEDGLSFDETKGICTWSASNECSSNFNQTDQKNDCEGTCLSNNSRWPHKECDRYCTCDGGRAKVHNCPSGLYYDRVSGTCAWPENAEVKSDCPHITDCTRASRPVPHNCNCNLYYKCEEGGKYLAKCPDGLYFDYVLGYCVDREPHCYHEYSTNRMVDNCRGYCPEQTPSSPITRLQHTDCNKYCVCSMGAPYIVNCPPCSRYDSQREACDDSIEFDYTLQVCRK